MKTEQQLLEDALDAALKRNLELEAEDVKKGNMIAYLSKRVNPLSTLAMLVLGNAQLAWEDDAALRGQIAGYFSKNVRVVSDSVMKPTLDGIIAMLSSSPGEEVEGGVTAGVLEVSGEQLLAGPQTTK